jgi:hypothetical protein
MGMAVGDEEVTDEELIAVGRSWVIRALNGGDRGGHYTKLLSDIRDPSTSASALSIRLGGCRRRCRTWTSVHTRVCVLILWE